MVFLVKAMQKKKYKVVTLGCRTNQYESQAYVKQLREKGFEEAMPGESADVCIVNTCTVTATADKKSLHAVRRLSRDYKPNEVIVTGCFAERGAVLWQELPTAVRIVPNARKEKLLEELFPEESWPEFAIDHFQAHTRAFVKIQDGCNSYCSYCIIPFVRGRSVSRSVESIVKEVKGLVEQGYREIVLTGINIGDFDGKTTPPTTLASLVRTLDKIPGLARLRLSSIDPDEVDSELLDAIVAGKRTCQSMHIVLQSGSNITLKRMRRKYTKEDFFVTVAALKKASPSFAFTTDVIVGFPGETESAFNETLEVVRAASFTKVHIFPYSERPKTRASRLENKVPAEVILERKERLKSVASEVAFRHRATYLGTQLDVLIEEKSAGDSDLYFGHSDNFLPVFVQKKEGVRSNEIVRVTCVGNRQDGLQGVAQ